MDVVLEVLDTYLFDYVYAKALPATPQLNLARQNPNGTYTTLQQGKENSYVYKPSTHLFQLEPSHYAYETRWPRDNIYRQAISLDLVVWYVFAIQESTCLKHC